MLSILCSKRPSCSWLLTTIPSKRGKGHGHGLDDLDETDGLDGLDSPEGLEDDQGEEGTEVEYSPSIVRKAMLDDDDAF